MKKIRALLVGIGGYGINYIRELTEKNVPFVQIEGICDVVPDLKKKFPIVEELNIPVFETVEEFYIDHQAEVAIISTPIHLHYSQIKTCLRNGSHVLTEKPVCTSVDGADDLVNLEKETNCFVAVGFQLNYSKDVLALKSDIIKGTFGKPIYMKALHAMSRGEKYYKRNNWAGKIAIHECVVNDSPFNNACAHQFQNMDFLLGKAMDQAAEILNVKAELYKANSETENFDTAAVCAWTKEQIPLYYYTTHNLKEQRLGPVSEYKFEKATIYYGKDYGSGPVMDYVAEMNDGTRYCYGEIPKGQRLQKLYDTIDCALYGGHPVCTIQCAIPHLEVVNTLAKLPIRQICSENLEYAEADGDCFWRIRNLKEIFLTCYVKQKMPSEVGADW